jgi:Ca2+-binding RTX toxin-like protein
VDGGAGTFDQFSAEPLTSATWVNFDTKSVTVGGVTLAASSAVSGTGVATVKGFEVAWGSTKNDIFAGGTGIDQLIGLNGDDWLYGNKGADTLYGGDGNDHYVYLAVTDSGTTKATRDVIGGFGDASNNEDVIDLSGIDANSKTAGVNDAFTLLGLNAAFTLGVAGQLRYTYQLGDTILEGDVNGDGKADFSIDIVGTQDLDSTDIAL